MADPIIQVELDLDQKKFDSKLKGIEQQSEKIGSSIGARLVVGVTAGLASFKLVKQAIESSLKQQGAINDLNRALAASGQYSKQASAGFVGFAESIEKASTIGGEVILQNAALIQSLGRLDQQGLRKATQAAVDLSSALGIDLRSASLLVGKAAQGEVGSFSRYGIAIKSASSNAETFKNALEAINRNFGGAAASKVNTFGGQIKILSRSFGDILEEFGNILVKSPAVIAIFKVLTKSITSLVEKISTFKLDRIITIDGIVAIGTAINNYIIAPFELVYNVARVVFNYINTTAAAIVSSVGYLGGKLGDLFNAIGISPEAAQRLKDFADTSRQVFEENQNALKESFDGVFDGSVYGNGEIFISNLRSNLEQAKSEIEASGIKNAIQPESGQPSFFDNFSAGFSQAEITLANFAEKTKAFGAQIRSNLQSGIANGAGQAFAAFGQALAKGENALDAFAKSFIASIGQIAIQQGTAFILQGIAYQFVPGFQGIGSGLIAAGAALATFGGVLSAFAGGGGGGAGATASGFGGGDVGTTAGFATSQERLEPQTAVNVTIQGSVFDSDETGLRIANILKENSINNNVRATVYA